MNNDFFFSTDQLLTSSDDHFVTVMLTTSRRTESRQIPLGTPILVSERSWNKWKLKDVEEDAGYVINGLIKFSTGGASPFYNNYVLSTELSKLYLIQKRDKCFANNHIIKEIETFELNKFNSLMEHINHYGSITLDFSNNPGALGAVDVLRLLSKSFEFSSIITSYFSSSSITKKMGVALDFYTLENIFPIFNHRKKEGLFAALYVYSKDNPTWRMSCCLTGVYTNHKANIFELDGAMVRPINRISGSTYEKVISFIKAAVQSDSNGIIQGIQRKPEQVNKYNAYYHDKLSKIETILMKNIMMGIDPALVKSTGMTQQAFYHLVKKAVRNKSTDEFGYKVMVELYPKNKDPIGIEYRLSLQEAEMAAQKL